MKKLGDLSLTCVADNLDTITRAGTFLPTVFKERILEILVNHDKLTQKYLPSVSYNLFSPDLKHITLYKCSQVTDGLLKILATTKCKLQQLTIHGCENVTDDGICALLYGQDELEVLELRKLAKFTGKGLQKIHLPKLWKLDLRESFINTQGLKSFLQLNQTVTYLNLTACTKLDDSVFHIIASCLNEKLETLDVADLHFMTDTSLEYISQQCPNLKMLSLISYNKISETGFKTLFNNCSVLEKLDLSYCRLLGEEPCSQCLLNLPQNLTQLSLCGVQISNQTLFTDAMQRMTSLTDVSLCGVPALTDVTLETVLASIGRKLEKLDLSGSVTSDITDEGLKYVTKYCVNLTQLFISLLRKPTGVTLLPMFNEPTRAENFTHLRLNSRKFDIEVLDVVCRKCTMLERLDVGGLQYVDDTHLVSLAYHCPYLSKLEIKSCNKVTDTGVCEVARLCPITGIVLSGCYRITDKSIFALANGCPYLEEVYLNGCARVTKPAIHYLVDTCIPRVYFKHRTPNADVMARDLDSGEYREIPNSNS